MTLCFGLSTPEKVPHPTEQDPVGVKATFPPSTSRVRDVLMLRVGEGAKMKASELSLEASGASLCLAAGIIKPRVRWAVPQ